MDENQINQVIKSASSSVDALADREQSDVAAVAGWAEALFLAGRQDEAKSVWQKMKDASARSDSQASTALYLIRADRLDEAITFSARLLKEGDYFGKNAWENGISELVEAAARASRHEPIISSLRKTGDPAQRLKSLGIAAEALARAGKTYEAAGVLGHASLSISSLKTEQRARALLDLAARARKANSREECIRFLRGAVVASRGEGLPTGPLLASARVFEELGEIDEALKTLREAILAIPAHSSWVGGWEEEFMQIAINAVEGGKSSSELLLLVPKGPEHNWYAHYLREAFLAAFIYTGHRGDIRSEFDKLNPDGRLRVIALAVKPLAAARRNIETELLLEEAARLLPALPLNYQALTNIELIEAAVDVSNPILLTKMIELFAKDSISESNLWEYLVMRRGGRVETILTSAWWIRKNEDRLYVVSSIIGRAESINQLDGNLNRLLSEVRASSALPDKVLANVSLALAKGGRVKAAHDIARRIKANREEILASVATAFIQSGRFDAALWITDKLKADRIRRSQTLASIIVELAGRGDDRSLELLPDVEYPGDVSRARSAIAKWQARSGEFSAARAMAEKCSSRDKLAAYTDLVIEYALKKKRIPSREALALAPTEQVEYLDLE